MSGVVKLLLQAFDFIDAFQPREKSARFGDKTFRLWHEEYKKTVAQQFAALGLDGAMPGAKTLSLRCRATDREGSTDTRRHHKSFRR